MDRYEFSKLGDALREESFRQDDYIIREGAPGDKFYILAEGSTIATKMLTPGEPTKVMDYAPGGYFGERALLTNEVRAANVVATSDCKCLTLDRTTFKRILGPLDDILRRNMESYKKYNP